MGQALVGGKDGLFLGHPTSIGKRIFKMDILNNALVTSFNIMHKNQKMILWNERNESHKMVCL